RGQDREHAREYWSGLLAGFDAANELPYDHRVAGPSDEPPREFVVDLPEEATARLQELCRRRRWTMSTLLEGAWAVLLARYSGQDEVVFGTRTSGRTPELAGIEEMVGLLITTLPVRAGVGGRRRVDELLGELQAQVQDSQRYGYAPLTEALFHSLVVF